MQTLAYGTQPAAAEHLSDAAITAAVELFFLTEKGVPAHLVDVATQGASRSSRASPTTCWPASGPRQ
ncbi:hypothetical protein ACFQ48_14805 [Hymenobacter caeli]|uniref:Uncharacterized protein n=1 Tax=Hymenobacter caeli TaxID=2735894 RepID=A0ABX2FT24_9BACT|nr:hypothetical protein [Hymenobacter caeli]NRT19592.1 hypothetical protein [Hymenobacter caeli]